MGQSHSLEVNAGSRALLDKALASPNGIIVRNLPTKTAHHIRYNCYNHRSRERKLSRTIFSEGDPGYNASPWDHISIKVHPHEDNHEVADLHLIPTDIILDALTIVDAATGEKLD